MNKSPGNIELFNESAALIFAELYKNFPVPVCLHYNNLATILCKHDANINQEECLEVLINTVAWLKKSDYIWLDSESELEVFGVVLNPRGYEVLKISPDSSTESTTIGERLINTNNASTKDERAALIKCALTEGYKTL